MADVVEHLEATLSDAISEVLNSTTIYGGSKDPSCLDVVSEIGVRLLETRQSQHDASAAVLRNRLLQLQKAMRITQAALADKVVPGEPTSRASFLKSLDEIIGPTNPGCSWEDPDPWFNLRKIAMRLKPWDDVDPTWSDERLLQWVRETNSVDQFISMYRQASIDALINRGWPEQQARCYAVLSSQGPALAKALRDRCLISAPCVHAIYNCLYIRATQPDNPEVPMLYRHLTGQYSLSEVDEKWTGLLHPDVTGFRGICSTGLTVADCAPDNFSAQGYLRRYQGENGTEYVPAVRSSRLNACASAPRPPIGETRRGMRAPAGTVS